MGAVSVARARLQRAATHPGTGEAFADEVVSAVGSAVGFDGWCLLGFDPVSGARSFMFCRDGVGTPRRLAHNESVERDVHRYVELSRAAVPVGVLRADDRRMAHSPRLQEILRPAGMTSELRIALGTQGRLWGALTLFREGRRGYFDDDDADVVLELAGALTAAVRRYPVHVSGPTPCSGPAPGVLVLDRDDAVTSITSEARQWLAEAVAGGFDEDRAGRIHRAVFDVARLARAGREPQPISRLRTARGFWLAVSASPLGPDGGVAVVLQRATAQQLLPAFGAWHGLTPRESDVVDAVLAGLSGKHIARRLALSTYTVEDHLSSVYRKTGVRGRDELVAQLL